MAVIAGFSDFRKYGPPADLASFIMSGSEIIFKYSHHGDTYVAAVKAGQRGWVPISADLDYPDGDVSTVFQDAIDALPNRGGELRVQAQTYQLIRKLELRTLLSLIGEGSGQTNSYRTTRLQQMTAGQPVLEIPNATSFIRLQGLNLVGNAGHVIYSPAVANARGLYWSHMKDLVMATTGSTNYCLELENENFNRYEKLVLYGGSGIHLYNNEGYWGNSRFDHISVQPGDGSVGLFIESPDGQYNLTKFTMLMAWWTGGLGYAGLYPFRIHGAKEITFDTCNWECPYAGHEYEILPYGAKVTDVERIHFRGGAFSGSNLGTLEIDAYDVDFKSVSFSINALNFPKTHYAEPRLTFESCRLFSPALATWKAALGHPRLGPYLIGCYDTSYDWAEQPLHPLYIRQRIGYTVWSNLVFSEAIYNNCGANNLRTCPFIIPRRCTMDRIGINVAGAGAGGAAAYVGIYKDDGTIYPGDLIVDGGTVDCTGTGIKLATIDVTLEPGLYWGVYLGNDGTVDVKRPAYCVAMLGTVPTPGWSVAQAYGALPATFPGGVGPTNSTPNTYYRIASWL